MIGEFSEVALALSFAQEHNSRERKQLAPLFTFSGLMKSLNHVLSTLKEKFQDPNMLPTYCFEYAPDC